MGSCCGGGEDQGQNNLSLHQLSKRKRQSNSFNKNSLQIKKEMILQLSELDQHPLENVKQTYQIRENSRYTQKNDNLSQRQLGLDQPNQHPEFPMNEVQAHHMKQSTLLTVEEKNKKQELFNQEALINVNQIVNPIEKLLTISIENKQNIFQQAPQESVSGEKKQEKIIENNVIDNQKQNIKLVQVLQTPSLKYPQKLQSCQVENSIQLIKQKDIFTQGIPNIGNTCFLNSVFQMFFSANSLKQLLLTLQKKKNPKFRLLKALAKILQLIEDSRSSISLSEEKQKSVKQFINLLNEISELKYKEYAQEDSLKFLLLIIDLISKEYLTIICYFEIEYEIVCSCNYDTQNQIFFKDYKIGRQKNQCQFCHKKCEIIINQASSFLIYMVDPVSERKIHKQIKYKNSVNLDMVVRFICISYIIYSGDGTSGHYIMHRKINNQWYCFNDSRVSLTNFGQVYGSQSILIALYENLNQ